LDIGGILAFGRFAKGCRIKLATQDEVALPFWTSGALMKSCVFSAVFFFAALAAFGQTPELKFIADTLVVQADGTYDADPDLATLTFQIFAQDKDIKRAYDTATLSMQHIIDIAQKNGLPKDDVRSGVLTVSPIYEGDRKKRARSYYVQGQEVLKVRDFAKIGPILDASVEDGVTDLRSLTATTKDHGQRFGAVRFSDPVKKAQSPTQIFRQLYYTSYCVILHTCQLTWL
jgi:uncharacterized protein YggE